MRVLQVVRQYSPGVGGLEGFVAELVQHLQAHGVCSDVLTLDRIFSEPHRRLPAVEEFEGGRIFRIPYVGSRRYPIAPRLLKYLSSYDLIHVHAVDFFADFLAATQTVHRKPMVLSTHGGFFHTHFASGLKELYFDTMTRQSLKAMDRVLACGISDYERFCKISDRVELVENGVNVSRYKAIERKPESGLLLSVGRLSSNKRVDRLISTLAELAPLMPAARLVLAGPDWDGLTKDLWQQAERLGIQDRVSIVGRVSESELMDLFSRAQLFVSASEYEGFGLTAVEAMASGVIPALQPIPSFCRMLKTGGGELVDFARPGEAARALAELMVSDRYQQTSEEAKAAAAQYAWPQVAARIHAIYRSSLGLNRRRIYGVQFTVLDACEAVQTIQRAIEDAVPLNVAFANAHTLNIARTDSSYRAVMSRMLVLNDGIGVSLASRFLYRLPFPANLNGTDLIQRLLSVTTTGLRIFLLGGAPGVADEAAREIACRYPQHVVVGTANGFFSTDEESVIIERINSLRPDILLVGMGNPIQEKWLDRHRRDLLPPVCIGVGALFDFLSGRVPRAPRLMRRVHMEWVFRLFIEPKRLWRRYVVGNVSFLVGLWSGSARMLAPDANAEL